MVLKPTSLASALVLVFAAWQAYGTLARMPAFNRSLQVEAVTGHPWPAVIQSLFEHSEYLYQMAHDRRAMGAEEVLIEGLEAIPSGDILAERSQMARADLIESLRHAPANAYAWALLAHVEYDLGDRQAASTALRNSQLYARNDARIALGRLFLLARVAAEPEEDDISRQMLDSELVAANVEIMRAYEPNRLRVVLESFPELAELVEMEHGEK